MSPTPPAPETDGKRAELTAEQARRIQTQLDEALADSVPASDPVSIVTSQTEEDWEA